MQFSASKYTTTMNTISKVRIVIAVFIVAALAFHSQIADALTMQGDADLSAGRPQRALAAYSRAVFFDPQSTVAITRYNNAAYFYGDERAQRDALRYGRLALAREPKNKELLVGMGLTARRIGDDYVVSNTYVRLGLLMRDARYLVMAGYAMHRLGDDSLARKTFELALKTSPRNPSALKALHRISERA